VRDWIELGVGRGSTLSLGAVLVCGCLLLSGCGGSDDSTPPSDTSTSVRGGSETTPSSGGSDSQGGGSGGSDRSPGADGGGAPKPVGGSQAGSGPASARVTPLKVSGGGSDQFRVKGGGDNSVQEFGEEGDEDQLREAAETVHDFYARRATGDWAGACALLSKSLKQQLEETAKSAPQAKRTDCPSFLAIFTVDLSPAEWRQITTVDAGSLRYEGEQAFLIYYGPERTVYAMPMIGEDGAWKVNALSAAALPGA